MGAVSIRLTSELETAIKQRVETADYDNRSEFVREAVREKLDGEDGDADA